MLGRQSQKRKGASMNDIVKFESDAGAMVEISRADVVNYICPTATDKEVALFLQLCAAQRLNPWVRDVHLVKYGDNPAQMITGKEVFTKRANAHPDFEGYEAGVTFVDNRGNVRQREGSAVYVAAGETLVGGWCRCYVKGRKPYFDEVALEEYNTGKSLWAKKPATMIRKVALVHCLREAFPDSFAGLYSQEEMGADDMPTQASKAAASVAVEPTQDASPQADTDTLNALMDKAKQLADLRGVDMKTAYDGVARHKAIKAMGFNGATWTQAQAEKGINILDAWIAKAAAESAPIEYDNADGMEPDIIED